MCARNLRPRARGFDGDLLCLHVHAGNLPKETQVAPWFRGKQQARIQAATVHSSSYFHLPRALYLAYRGPITVRGERCWWLGSKGVRRCMGSRFVSMCTLRAHYAWEPTGRAYPKPFLQSNNASKLQAMGGREEQRYGHSKGENSMKCIKPAGWVARDNCCHVTDFHFQSTVCTGKCHGLRACMTCPHPQCRANSLSARSQALMRG